MSVNEAPERIWWNPEGHWSSYDDSAIRQSPSFEYITVAASDARVDAAVRAGLERAAMKCDAARDFRNEQRRKNSGEHRDWLQRWAAGAMQADLLAVTIRALAADDAAVARIARGLAP